MAKRKAKAANKKQRAKRVHLIVSDSTEPSVKVKPGMKLHVVSVKLVDSGLKQIKPIAATLCGGTSTCVAMFES